LSALSLQLINHFIHLGSAMPEVLSFEGEMAKYGNVKDDWSLINLWPQ
jgi:hypothetical protein